MIELFGDATGNTYRAAVALEEAGLTFEPRRVRLAQGEHRAAEYLSKNPTGRVPTLVDPEGPDGKPLVLTQSNAIMFYAAEKSGTLMPRAGIGRVRALEWLFFFVTDVIAPNNQGTILMRDPRLADGGARLNERAVSMFEHAEVQLSGGEFLAGDAFTLADIAGFVITSHFDSRLRWERLPSVRRWFETVGARAGVERGMCAFR